MNINTTYTGHNIERNLDGTFKKGFSYSVDTQFKKNQHWRTPQKHWDKEWLIKKYYDEKLSTPEIAKLCQCTTANIKFWLAKHNLKARNVSEARKVKKWGLTGELNGMYGRSGKSNPRWQGGITPQRQSVYSSTEWKNIIKTVYKRDNYICQRCFSHHLIDNPLHIHHIVTFKNKKLRIDLNNLILICKKCHLWIHSKKNINKTYLKNA